jgi:hypothetical protein
MIRRSADAKIEFFSVYKIFDRHGNKKKHFLLKSAFWGCAGWAV